MMLLKLLKSLNATESMATVNEIVQVLRQRYYKANLTREQLFQRERLVFFQRQQAELETFDQFLQEIKTIAKRCNFGHLEDSMLKSQFVLGLRDVTLREMLKINYELSLDSMMDHCKSGDTAKCHQTVLESAVRPTMDNHFVVDCQIKKDSDQKEVNNNTESSMSGRKVFNIKQKVFAKIRGHSPWPAIITGIKNKNSSQITYLVRFYGTGESGNCTANQLFPYEENKLKLGIPKKLKYFNQAIYEIENDNGDVENIHGSSAANEGNSTQSLENVRSEYQPVVKLVRLSDKDIEKLTKKRENQNPENTDKDVLETFIQPEIINTPASVVEEKKLLNITNKMIEDGEVPGPSNCNFFSFTGSSVVKKSIKSHPLRNVPFLINDRAKILLDYPPKNKDKATASLKNIPNCLKHGKLPSG